MVASSSGCGTTTLTTDAKGKTMTCIAINSAGQTRSNSVTINMEVYGLAISRLPAHPCTLRPPDHMLAPVADVKAGARISGLMAGSFQVAVTGNEPASNSVITPDGSGGFDVQVRQKLVRGDAGVYSIQAKASSATGNTSTGTASCTVTR